MSRSLRVLAVGATGQLFVPNYSKSRSENGSHFYRDDLHILLTKKVILLEAL